MKVFEVMASLFDAPCLLTKTLIGFVPCLRVVGHVLLSLSEWCCVRLWPYATCSQHTMDCTCVASAPQFLGFLVTVSLLLMCVGGLHPFYALWRVVLRMYAMSCYELLSDVMVGRFKQWTTGCFNHKGLHQLCTSICVQLTKALVIKNFCFSSISCYGSDWKLSSEHHFSVCVFVCTAD